MDALRLFPILSRRQDLKRFLAHVELFKLSMDVPGDILEVGVYRGQSLMTWANLLECYCIGNRTKTVWGVDAWSGFTELSIEDGLPDPIVGKAEGGFDSSSFAGELQEAIEIFDSDRFVNWKQRIQLLDGKAELVVPKLISQRPGLRFSLVHFDVDLYLPTLETLHAVWSRIPQGGVLVFDEYAIQDWPGETQAVDEFLRGYPQQQLRTFSWSNVPGAYLIKA